MNNSRKRPRASSPDLKSKRSKRVEFLETNSTLDVASFVSNSGSSGSGSCNQLESPTKGIRKQLKAATLSNRKPKRKRQEDVCWHQEDAEFLLPEEGEGFIDDGNLTHSFEDHLPVRYLDNFTIYDEKAGRMIDLDEVEESDTVPYFEGAVRAKLVDTEAEDVVNPHLLRSTTILSVWQSEAVESSGTTPDLDEIWIRTSFSWYILLRPSTDYAKLFLPRWIQHNLFLLLIRSSQNPKVDFKRFQKRFLRDEAKWAKEIFGQDLTQQDMDDNIQQVLQMVDESSEAERFKVEDTRLFEEIRERYPSEGSIRATPRTVSSYNPTERSPSARSDRTERPPTRRDPNPRLTKTFCTPFIHHIAKNYFPGLREDDDTDSSESESESMDGDFPKLNVRPKKVLEIKAPLGEYEEGVDDLEWVQVGRTRYRPGDTVIIRPNGYSLDLPDQLAWREAVNHLWFGKIIYLGIKSEEYIAHILWLMPACQTTLKELAHPQELMMVARCDNINVAAFIQPFSLSRLGIDVDEPPLPNKDNYSEYPFDSFFYRYFWVEENDDALIEVENFSPDLSHLDIPHISCASCEHYSTLGRAQKPRVLSNNLIFNGVEYHKYDFVYITPEANNSLYEIGQLFEIGPNFISVRRFRRSPRPSNPNQFYDDRLLIADPVNRLTKYKARRLDGKCSIFSGNSHVLGDNQFHCDLDTPLTHCPRCSPELLQILNPVGSPLRGLDLFSGAGGLSLGLRISGAIEAKYAVEYDASSARTFKAIHPECTMFNVCINSLLRHAAESEAGANSEPLSSLDSEELPPFPVAGDIDIIYGGPPCQGFTLMNRSRRIDDPRNELILSFLSAVDMLKPKFVILENVRGMLSFRLQHRKLSMKQNIGAIEHGVIKLLRRLLSAMNYQVRYGILHAGQYGAPQIRRRIIFIAAKRGIPLPDLPQATHLTPEPTVLDIVIEGHGRFTVNKKGKEVAALDTVTVQDTIGDLPAWEWRNPYMVCRPPKFYTEAERAKMGINIVDCDERPSDVNLGVAGPANPMPYAQRPLNRYQQWMREESHDVLQHWTPAFAAKEIERICSIPFTMSQKIFNWRRYPDHNDLPESLRHHRMFGKRDYRGRYGRLYEDGIFSTVLGKLVPNAPAGRILHPKLHRIITIREAARSQGFPDHIEFQVASRSVHDITQQIGNAVPVPMAIAIGKEILKVTNETRRSRLAEEDTYRGRSVEMREQSPEL